jgi:hypothetical protein
MKFLCTHCSLLLTVPTVPTVPTMPTVGNEIPMRFTRAGQNLSLVLTDFIHTHDVAHSGRQCTSAYPMLVRGLQVQPVCAVF